VIRGLWRFGRGSDGRLLKDFLMDEGDGLGRWRPLVLVRTDREGKDGEAEAMAMMQGRVIKAFKTRS